MADKNFFKSRIFIIAVFALLSIAILSAYPFITGKVVLLSPSVTDICKDSDGKLSLTDQSKQQGNIFVIHKECNWTNLYNPNITQGLCAMAYSYNDYCINTTTIAEKTCSLNVPSTSRIACINGCNNGKCL